MNIRQTIVILIILSGAAGVRAQAPSNAELVRTLIGKHSGDEPRASILFKSLVSVDGRILGADRSAFYLRFRTKGGNRVMNSFRFEDVLYIKVGKEELNLLPAPAARPYGNWDDIKKIYPGTRIFVVLEGNRTFEGWSNSATGEKLIVLNENAKETVEFDCSNVIAFYGMLGGYGGVKKNASKAAEGMSSGRDKLLGGMLVGAAALLGMAKSDGQPILIYSK